VSDEFKALFELIERLPADVSGRERRVISADMEARLANLAAGNCSESERRELLTLLAQRSDLIAVLAKEIKKLRNVPG
jgi:hypothetical protein